MREGCEQKFGSVFKKISMLSSLSPDSLMVLSSSHVLQASILTLVSLCA